MKPRLLDLFSKAGGSAMGYHRAGFEVVGVDIEPQPRYPFEFHQGDALEFLAEHGHEFDAIHASPPCQDYSHTRSLHAVHYPRLIAPVRLMLLGLGHPTWVIENVEGARAHMRNPVTLCGSSFGLGVRRHRLFETSPPIWHTPACAHYLQPAPVDVTGTGASRTGPRLDGKGGNSRKPRNLAHAREVMGIDWMTRRELSEAVPPAFTEYLGELLMEQIEVKAA
jgi:DNA (cytosine-5)-methyltransferase 1